MLYFVLANGLFNAWVALAIALTTVAASLTTIATVAAMAPNAFAADVPAAAPMIFDVRINLPLEPDEVSYHDFYINAGPDAGFKRGMYLTVVRPVPVHDPVQNKQQGTLNISVARLQVIQVERNLTVARLFSEFTDEERPTLEYEAVMIGDRIDMSSATMEAPNSKKSRREAAKQKRLEEQQANSGLPSTTVAAFDATAAVQLSSPPAASSTVRSAGEPRVQAAGIPAAPQPAAPPSGPSAPVIPAQAPQPAPNSQPPAKIPVPKPEVKL